MQADRRRRIVDAYGHVSLPRFLSAEQFLAVLDANAVESAIIATADTCPDLGELSRSIVAYGDRLRAVGMPVGRTPAEIEAGIAAQLAAGFLGIRLPARLIAEQPALMDVIGRAGGLPFVVGEAGLGAAARPLLDFLDRFPDARVCAPHFGGVTDTGIFKCDDGVRRLFEHPRLLVIFSRQGAQDQALIGPWARDLVQRVGWDRLLFGSEYPVALWRDETYADTLAWIDSVGLRPTAAERAAFEHGNARRHLFERPLTPPRAIDPRWCDVAMQGKREAPVWLFPRGTLDLPEEVHGRLQRMAGKSFRTGTRSTRPCTSSPHSHRRCARWRSSCCGRRRPSRPCMPTRPGQRAGPSPCRQHPDSGWCSTRRASTPGAS